MHWYFVRDGKQVGPHSDEALQDYVRSGLIDASTLVWREGMDNWQPISQAVPELVLTTPGGSPGPALAAGVQCAECGGVFAPSDLVSLGGSSVCARCKPVRLQKMREGVSVVSGVEELKRLLRIAKGQRGVNLAILIGFLAYGFLILGGALVPGTGGRGAPNPAVFLGLAGMVMVLGAVIFQVISVYRLASALGHMAILWVLGVVFLSCIGLILLLILSSQATKELRKAGFKVGLLGGDPKEIEQRLRGV